MEDNNNTKETDIIGVDTIIEEHQDDVNEDKFIDRYLRLIRKLNDMVNSKHHETDPINFGFIQGIIYTVGVLDGRSSTEVTDMYLIPPDRWTGNKKEDDQPKLSLIKEELGNHTIVNFLKELRCDIHTVINSITDYVTSTRNRSLIITHCEKARLMCLSTISEIIDTRVDDYKKAHNIRKHSGELVIAKDIDITDDVLDIPEDTNEILAIDIIIEEIESLIKECKNIIDNLSNSSSYDFWKFEFLTDAIINLNYAVRYCECQIEEIKNEQKNT